MWEPRENLAIQEPQEERDCQVIALKESPERRAPLEMCLEHRDPLVLRERQVLRENQE